MNKTGTVTMQQWVRTTLEKRALYMNHESTFYLHLIAGERGACPWQGMGYASFDRVLQEFKLADVLRYRRFYGAVTVVKDAERFADKNGIDAVITAANITDEGQRAQFVEQVEAATKVRPRGAPLTLEELRRIRKDVAPRARARTDQPRSVGLPEVVRVELEQLVLDMRKAGGTVQASALAIQFIREGIARSRREMLESKPGRPNGRKVRAA